jgi:DNA-binding response OmpR family regulator
MKDTGVSPVRILVVEDEPVIARVCLLTLTLEGFEADLAVNGKVAEGMLEQGKYDLVLIDIRTPVMDGKQLFVSITEKHPELVSRVIFTTGDVLGGNTNSFIDHSERLFLAKPFTPDELKAAVREALRRLQK